MPRWRSLPKPGFNPHVVIYEWNVRDGGGIDLAQSMRDAAVGTNPLVLAISTLDEPDGFRLSEGIDEYLTKPFQVEVLDALLVKAALVDGRTISVERQARSE